MIAIIFIIACLVCATTGFVVAGLCAASGRASLEEELKAAYAAELEDQDRMHKEDVRRLRDEYESQIVKLNDAHRRDVVRQASALHKRECRNIAKRGKERGAVTGANA